MAPKGQRKTKNMSTTNEKKEPETVNKAVKIAAEKHKLRESLILSRANAQLISKLFTASKAIFRAAERIALKGGTEERITLQNIYRGDKSEMSKDEQKIWGIGEKDMKRNPYQELTIMKADPETHGGARGMMALLGGIRAAWEVEFHKREEERVKLEEESRACRQALYRLEATSSDDDSVDTKAGG
jgi:hypothetical protein